MTLKNIVKKTPSKSTIDRKQAQVLRTLQSKEGQMAATITRFAGSMGFVYIHALWFVLWILINHGFFGSVLPIFDPFPYGLLTMIVSLEAIFLSTFIMVAQNRQALLDTYRDLEEDKEQQEEEQQQVELEENVEELQEDVQDIQQDLDDILKAIGNIQQRLTPPNKPRQ